MNFTVEGCFLGWTSTLDKKFWIFKKNTLGPLLVKKKIQDETLLNGAIKVRNHHSSRIDNLWIVLLGKFSAKLNLQKQQLTK